DLMVCGEAEDPPGAIAITETVKPDLAVVAISLKDQNGLELIKDFKVRAPQLLILVLSMHDESLYAERALRAGARGYIMKREASCRVLDAIRQILGGGIYVSDQMMTSILDKVSGRLPTDKPAALAALSDRELEVVLLIGQGYGTQQIASQLHISVKTIETYRANLKLKLKLNSSSELLQSAIRWSRELGAS
ncbi:MAG: response regulator transcription factor, partial [Kiritimatiellaeota bacterium]|nr:response regulator transcription factor [Kiritimatiellota bacterium]